MKWGSIDEVLNADLIDVPQDAWYISVVCMWFTCLYNLIQGIFGGLVKMVFVCFSVGTCWIPCSDKLCSAMGSVLMGRPLFMAFTWWRYVLSALIALVANGKSRLTLFMWEWESFGSGDYWWHGEGVWCWKYVDCERILKSYQDRKAAFGAVRACIPDLFPTNLLIFLPTGGQESHWYQMRHLLHAFFLDTGLKDYRTRMTELPGKVREDWKNPKLEDLSDLPLVQRMVSKCIFWMMFGKWVSDVDADVLAKWRTLASQFILPRLVHRFLFNLGIKKVKQTRAETVEIVKKYGVDGVFYTMNGQLGEKYRKKTVVELCDEVMFAIGFAGIGGTCAAVESVGSFLQCKIPAESAAKHIKWGQYDTSEKMVAKYKANPEKYIKETCRMDPPVTSATTALMADTKITLKGKEYTFPKHLLNQYVLSMANRDESVFKDVKPEVFEPDREHLNKALTWNGAFGASDEGDFPRICPGRYLSLDVTTTIVHHALGIRAEETASTLNGHEVRVVGNERETPI